MEPSDLSTPGNLRLSAATNTNFCIMDQTPR